MKSYQYYLQERFIIFVNPATKIHMIRNSRKGSIFVGTSIDEINYSIV